MSYTTVTTHRIKKISIQRTTYNGGVSWAYTLKMLDENGQYMDFTVFLATTEVQLEILPDEQPGKDE